MHTVFLSTTKAPVSLPHEVVDEQFESLQQWADSLQTQPLVLCP
jgi:hypothetical protein